MNIKQIQDDLRRHEGFIPHAYQDHLGYWTIGIGQLIDVRRGGKISLNAAEFMLAEKLDEIIESLNALIPWWKKQPASVQRALINMAYQLGVNGLMRFKRMLAAIKEHDYDNAVLEALDSKWAQQTPERAEEVAGWILQGGSSHG